MGGGGFELCAARARSADTHSEAEETEEKKSAKSKHTLLLTRKQPLGVLLEADGRHVAHVPVVAEHRLRVVRVDLVQPDLPVSGSSHQALLRRDLQAVDLRVGVLQRAVADAAGGLPEADGVVVARGGQDDGRHSRGVRRRFELRRSVVGLRRGERGRTGARAQWPPPSSSLVLFACGQDRAWGPCRRRRAGPAPPLLPSTACVCVEEKRTGGKGRAAERAALSLSAARRSLSRRRRFAGALLSFLLSAAYVASARGGQRGDRCRCRGRDGL